MPDNLVGIGKITRDMQNANNDSESVVNIDDSRLERLAHHLGDEIDYRAYRRRVPQVVVHDQPDIA
jgi:hypothetical protein